MASASGNLEGQLESVEEQIREDEVRIGIVEKEVSRLGDRILLLEEKVVLVEEQAKKSSDDEERKLLLGEKAQLQDQKIQLRHEKIQLQDQKIQLRHEKIQLQDQKIQLLHEKIQLRDQIARFGEKAQLRDEKIQLLQRRRDLGTEHEWLVQEVVVPDVSSRSLSYPSTSAKGRRYRPVKVEHWDLKGDIEELFERADKRKRAYDLYVTYVTQGFSEVARMEEQFVMTILCELRHFLEKKQPQLKFGISRQIPLASMEKRRAETDKADEADEKGLNEVAKFSSDLIEFCILNPKADFVLTFEEKNVVVVEVKNGGLGPDQGDPWHLHKAWTECTCPTGEGDPNCSFKVGYGILTDCRDWYLFKRDHKGCLKISSGFKGMGGHPPVLGALLYLVDIASKDNTKFGNGPWNGETPKLHGVAPIESFKSNPDFRKLGNDVGILERPRSTRNQPDENQLDLKDVSVVDLNLKMAGGIISCEGWSGCVAVGCLFGQPVAMKFAYVNTERARALLKEIVAYQRMEKLWGVFVPRLIGCGTTCDGQAIFVATELIDGVELGKEALIEEVKIAAFEALDVVHECGILHGDIEERNIMVVQGKQPPVRILDFG